MITTNNPGGNNYDGPIWSPYLNWDYENEEGDWVAEIEELNDIVTKELYKDDDKQDIEFTPDLSVFRIYICLQVL